MNSPFWRWRGLLPLLGLIVGMLDGAAARAAEATEPEPLPVEELFVLPNVRQPRLSPDGKKIAFLAPHEKKMALAIFDRVTKESHFILRGADESFNSFFWKGNDRIVFEADVSGNESFFIGATDLGGKNVLRIAESQRIQNNLTGDFASVIDQLKFDPERIAVFGYFAGNIDNATFVGGAPVVARVNVRNRGLSPLFEVRDSVRYRVEDFVFDARGTLRLRNRIEGRTIIWEYRPDDSAPFKEVARHPMHGYAETWHPEFFAADNKTLWLISREEHDRGALYAYNTDTLERGPAIFVPPEGEISDLITNYDRSKLLGVSYQSDRLHYHWMDEARGALQAKLENTFKGTQIIVSSTSADEKVMLLHVSHDREAGAYFVLDLNKGSLDPFKRVFDIKPEVLSSRKEVVYTSRDGLPIHAYLTIPRGTAGKNLPLIMHPHGGPFGIRDTWGYDRDAQFLASRGYAVLQPNYRGSGGYGRDFIDKGRFQWGRAMQDDLTDGVKWAIDQGIADPKRIAIYGASYGGYASLMGVIGTPDLYACGVNYVGPTDLEITFHGRGEDAWRFSDEFAYQREWVGPTKEYRDATSPIKLVDRIKVPTLHAYGAEDPRVVIEHWYRFEPLLKKYQKVYKSKVEGKQGHGFRDQDAGESFYRLLEIFLAENLGGKVAKKAEKTESEKKPGKK